MFPFYEQLQVHDYLFPTLYVDMSSPCRFVFTVIDHKYIIAPPPPSPKCCYHADCRKEKQQLALRQAFGQSLIGQTVSGTTSIKNDILEKGNSLLPVTHVYW